MQKMLFNSFKGIFAIEKEKITLLQKQANVDKLVKRFANIMPQQGGYIHPNPLMQPKLTGRKFKAKHANPKYKRERGQKVVKFELPDFHKNKSKDPSPEEVRLEMKKLGIQPFRPWNERPMFIAATSAIMEPYIPPEGDGKATLVSTERAKQALEFMGKKSKSMMTIRKIRQYEEDFDYREFTEEALQIYIKLHEALAKFDEKELHKLATERAYPSVVNEVKYKTLRWGFHGSLEPARVVYARETSVMGKENIFAQLTVRFHTQQTLAVYDRFGRLIHGSESVLKDVLEYIVFEKHISNVYGLWRIHDKIIPPWMHIRPVSHRTFVVPPPETASTTSEEASEASST